MPPPPPPPPPPAAGRRGAAAAAAAAAGGGGSGRKRGGGAARAPGWRPPAIANYRALATGRAQRRALRLLEAGLGAASPRDAVLGAGASAGMVEAEWSAGSPRGPIELSPYAAVKIVAFGKAAFGMAAAAREAFGAKVDGGIVVAPAGAPAAPLGRGFRVMRAAHPEPDRSSVEAARAVERYVSHRRGSELLLFLVSGGGSSLLCMPDGVDLPDKARTIDLLGSAGAPISDVNCVRKHLSRIKGGRLAAAASCDAAALLMSDVAGDDPAVVSSGAAYGDPTTFADALGAVQGRGLGGSVPQPVMDRLRSGAAGRIPDTPEGPVVPNAVLAGNAACLAAMESRAAGMGYSVARTIAVSGDVGDAAARIAAAWDRSGGRGSCIVFGGEATVRVRRGGGKRGRGGRCQELVARIVREISGGGGGLGEAAVVAAIGTDGIDGTTESAGAVACTDGADAAAIGAHVDRSDTGGLFEERSSWAAAAGRRRPGAAGGGGGGAAILGGPVITGHTGTNLGDIGVVVPAEAGAPGGGGGGDGRGGGGGRDDNGG